MSRIAVHPAREMAALSLVGGLDDMRVLEVGCGDGRLTLAYARRTRSVVGIDPDEERIAEARRTLPPDLTGLVRFEVGDVVELLQPPAAFDAVFLSHSL